MTILAGAGDSDTIDSWGPIGADGIWLEGEHGPVDFNDISDLTRACDLWGMTSVLRIHQNEYGVIYRALDRGAQALVMPHVNTKEEVEYFVNAAKFAPIGKRGLFVSRQGYGVQDYVKIANDHTRAHHPDRGYRGRQQAGRDPDRRSHRRVLRGTV